MTNSVDVEKLWKLWGVPDEYSFIYEDEEKTLIRVKNHITQNSFTFPSSDMESVTKTLGILVGN